MNKVEPIRTKEDLHKILNYLRGQKPNGLRNYTLFLVGCNTSLRISDLRLLRWGTVMNQKFKFKPYVEITETKTKKKKQFELSKLVQKALLELLEEQKRKGEVKLTDYVFQSRQGQNQPISRFQVSRFISEAGKVLDVPNLNCHSMRKTWGYWQWAFFGQSEVLIRNAFSHADWATTRRYLCISDEEIRKMYNNEIY